MQQQFIFFQSSFLLLINWYFITNWLIYHRSKYKLNKFVSKFNHATFFFNSCFVCFKFDILLFNNSIMIMMLIDVRANNCSLVNHHILNNTFIVTVLQFFKCKLTCIHVWLNIVIFKIKNAVNLRKEKIKSTLRHLQSFWEYLFLHASYVYCSSTSSEEVNVFICLSYSF